MTKVRILRRLVPLAATLAVAVPLVPAQPAAAQVITAGGCTGSHTWSYANSVVTLSLVPATGAETWDEQCPVFTTTPPSSGGWTITPNRGNYPFTYEGDCGLVIMNPQTFGLPSMKMMVGNVEVGQSQALSGGTGGNTEVVEVGTEVQETNGGTPCDTWAPVTWSGYQSWTAAAD